MWRQKDQVVWSLVTCPSVFMPSVRNHSEVVLITEVPGKEVPGLEKRGSVIIGYINRLEGHVMLMI